jgi:Ca2+-binding EF-hand superfamily protein
MKEVFELFDADSSGSVDEEELAAAMFALGLADTIGASGRSSGGVRGGLRAAAQQMMASVDVDGSRTVDLAEFTALMQALPYSESPILDWGHCNSGHK